MKFGSQRWLSLTVAGLCLGAALHGELQQWVRELAAGPRLDLFLRTVPAPQGGTVAIRRPPAETRPALSALIQGAPADAELRRLRAQEAELALDFTAAETDWREYARIAPDKGDAYLALADYFHRRAEPQKEVEALEAAAGLPADRFAPAERQRPWIAYQRIVAVAKEAALPQETASRAMRAWVARYRTTARVYSLAVDYFREHRRWADAEAQIAAYRRAFPADQTYPVTATAELRLARDSVDAAIRGYDEAFAPHWPRELSEAYFEMLERHGRVREFAGRARAALSTNPADLNATARLFHYFVHQNNAAAQRRVLVEYRLAKENRKLAWTAAELVTAAHLFERISDGNEAARLYYALYSLPGAQPGEVETALAGLTELLLTSPGQGIRFGMGDLSIYRDIATADASPGFLNGLLSLVLNSTSPRWNYGEQDRKAGAYFQRSRAAELVALLEQRFPQSSHRASLRAKLIEAHAAYQDDAAVVEQARVWLARFSSAPERLDVALTLTDSYARLNQTRDEFDQYDKLLGELAAQAEGVPLGSDAVERTGQGEQFMRFPGRFVGYGRAVSNGDGQQPAARSPGYERVLERYLSRLAALKRPMDALAVYRREIDRNPRDPALYRRLAAFVDQNRLAQETEAVYRRAMANFPDRSWHHALARWYLRDKRTNEFARLTREVTGTFAGSELGQYFKDIVASANLDAALYLEVNRFAHERFPQELDFVRNLLSAYSRAGTQNGAAYDAILRAYWYYDDGLRRRYLEKLSGEGRLARDLGVVRTSNPTVATNPAAVQFLAAGEAWLSHFEAAAPPMRLLAQAYPGHRDFTAAAGSLHRSLGATVAAVALAEQEWRGTPREAGGLEKAGEVQAEREQFRRARAYWDRIPQLRPGDPAGYLTAATLYWDYFQFDDALRIIGTARGRFAKPALFAYEAGAIQEGRRAFDLAIAEYVRGASADDNQCRARLVTLSTRATHREGVERATLAAPLWVRAAILEAQQRRSELEPLFSAAAARSRDSAELARIEEAASRLGFGEIERRAKERQAEVSPDPLERMRHRIALAKLHESHQDLTSADRVLATLRRDYPLVLGVIRADVDFRIRNHQTGQATAILLEAARAARPELAERFTLEAARVETGAARTTRARELVEGLLKTDPYRPEYLAAMADTWAQAGDEAAFRTYQLAAIERMTAAPLLSAADKASRIVSMRRSLIPVLARLGDHAGATEQYIESINSYPEDEELLRAATRFAITNGRVEQLKQFYRRTIEQAPRDYRWPIVLARIETVAEDYPAAVKAYETAIKARPDRADIVEHRAVLEERLLRLGDAATSYRRLYDLTYREPQWMIKVAEMRVRLGEKAAAVEALRAAVVGAKSETAPALFEMAGRLDGWNLIGEAADLADRGASLAGADLWTTSEAATYARILARARQMPKLLSGAPADAASALSAAARVVGNEYSPAERDALRPLLDARPGEVYTQFAAEAGLFEVEARRRFEAMMARGEIDASLASLQSQRGVYAEWARQLERFASARPGGQDRAGPLAQAAQAYLSEGDEANATRLAAVLTGSNALGGPLLEWHLATLSLRDRPQLLSLIASRAITPEVRNRAVQFAITNGDAAFAREAVQARGQRLVWTRLYTGLAGLHFLDPSPAVNESFRTGLGDGMIGERVSAKVNHDEQLAGNLWFYFGARYGEYLDAAKRAGAEDYLSASLEAAPDSAHAYLSLGDYYAARLDHAKAVVRYEQALELDADLGAAHSRIASIWRRQGKKDEAIARWRSALGALLAVQSRGVRVPESYWPHLTETINEIGKQGALADLQPDIERVLADYAHRNGGYRLNALLEAGYLASLRAGQPVGWVIRIAESASEADNVLAAIERLPDLTPAQRTELAQQRLVAAEKAAATAMGWNLNWAMQRVDRARLALAERRLAGGDVAGTEALLRTIASGSEPAGHGALEMRISAVRRVLPALFERYRSKPAAAPPVEAFRLAATALRDADAKAADMVLEFLYTRELERLNLDASNFLGLASAQLGRGDTSAAVGTLRRMTLVAGEPFELLMPAAETLERSGKMQEAAQFVADRTRAVPWDGSAKLALARLRGEKATEPPVRDSTDLPPIRAALADAPRDNALRLSAVRAALSARQDRLAFSLVAPLDASLQDPDLAQALARGAERLGDRRNAIRYLSIARRSRPALQTRIDALRAEQALLEANAARQPIIRDQLEQPAVVQPRLERSAQ